MSLKLQYTYNQNKCSLNKNDLVLDSYTMEIMYKNLNHIREYSCSSGREYIQGVSLVGKGHIKDEISCQDYHFVKSIDDGWGIVIVSDGAGSSKFSEIGSKLTSERGGFYFEELLLKSDWIKNCKLPSEKEWDIEFRAVVSKVRLECFEFAKEKSMDLRDLNSTFLAMIYSPVGVLFGHIGDGRAAVLSSDGKWSSLMIPHKGEEANQTVFLQSELLIKTNLKVSGVFVPETTVFNSPVRAFVLISDGCEKAMWQCGQMINKEEGIHFIDPNTPHSDFMNPFYSEVLKMKGYSSEKAKKRFVDLIDRATPVLEIEMDDKTCVFGLLQ